MSQSVSSKPEDNAKIFALSLFHIRLGESGEAWVTELDREFEVHSELPFTTATGNELHLALIDSSTLGQPIWVFSIPKADLNYKKTEYEATLITVIPKKPAKRHYHISQLTLNLT